MREFPIERRQNAVQLCRVVFVHQHIHRDGTLGGRVRRNDVEAAEMRAIQQAKPRPCASWLPRNTSMPSTSQSDLIVATGEKKYAIEISSPAKQW
mgnify:CR=1 FL=1